MRGTEVGGASTHSAGLRADDVPSHDLRRTSDKASASNSMAHALSLSPFESRSRGERSKPEATAKALSAERSNVSTVIDTNLDREVKLLDLARAALAAGRHDLAEQHLNASDRDFPRGGLSPEARRVRFKLAQRREGAR